MPQPLDDLLAALDAHLVLDEDEVKRVIAQALKLFIPGTIDESYEMERFLREKADKIEDTVQDYLSKL